MSMPKKRPELFEIRYSNVPNGANHWRIVGYPNGVRKQYWHPTEEAAERDAKERNLELTAHGSQLAVSAVDRARWQGLIERLAPYGADATPERAIDHYIEHLRQKSRTVPFSVLSQKIREEFKRRKEHNEVSSRHIESMHETLHKMEAAFGDRTANSITSQDIRQWLIGLPLAAKTHNKHRGYAGQVFSLAKDFGYCVKNPVSEVKPFNARVSEENGKINILTPEDTKKLMHAAAPEIIPFLALLFFAGIRRSTLESMDWSEINLAEKRATVPAYKGKNQRRYHVHLSDNLLAWLAPYAKESGSLLPLSQAMNSQGNPSIWRARDLIAAAAEKAGVTLPDNAGRHSFISYHVALHGMDSTSQEADNSVKVIKEDYLHLVTKQQAAKYWAIRP